MEQLWFFWRLLGFFSVTATSSITNRDVSTEPPLQPTAVSPDPSRLSYLAVSPSVYRDQVPFSVSITNLYSQDIYFTLEILHQDRVQSQGSERITRGSTELIMMEAFDSSSLTIDEGAPLWLKVQGNAASTGERLVSNRTKLQYEPRIQTTLIQTDRAHYQPGQSVKIRVLSLQRDGRPLNSSKDIHIKDPGGNLLRQWLSAESVLGITSIEFQLSQNPPLGNWTIEATVESVSTEKLFTVAEYALPKFKVEVHAPSVIYRRDRLTGTITAKYFHGKDVSGSVSISFTHCSQSCDKTYERHFLINGLQHFHFELPSDEEMSFSDNEHLEIQAQVTEITTGLQYNGSTMVGLAKDLYKLSFEGHRNILRPLSTFNVQLQVQKYDGSVPSGSDLPKVQVTVLQQKTTPWTWSQPVDYGMTQSPEYSDEVSGNMNMELSVPEDGLIPLSIELRADTKTLIIDVSFMESYNTLMVYSSYVSLSKSYLQIHRPSSPAEVGSSVRLKIWSSFPLKTYSYLVKSKGQILLTGSSSGDLVLKPDFSWTPVASVMVFVVLSDGEIVNDVIQLQIKQSLQNHVSLSWSESTLKPNQRATLTASVSEPHSLVGILVVDMATQRDSAHNDITTNTVLEELGKHDALKKDELVNMLQMGDPYTLFTECELLVLTDASLNVVNNPLIFMLREAPDLMMQQNMEDQDQTGLKQIHTRVNFPETWIWMDLDTGNSSTAEVSTLTPDSITTWVATAFVVSQNLGLGVLEVPVELTVFQDFFISLNLPAFITRGEELLLEISLFNYRSHDLTTEVTVDESEHFEFLSGHSGSQVHEVLVKHGAVASLQVPIKALKLGEGLVSVKAVSSEGSDHVQRTLLVKPEGRPQSFTQSLLLHLSDEQPTASDSITFSIPSDRVEGSCQIRVSAVADIMGVAIRDLDSLIQMPSGCGEQNMINLAPNVYVLQYLNSSGQTDSAAADRATALMLVGYEQELTFQRRDGSFSAFGDNDQSGSTWLSAFVLRCFLQARPFIPVSPEVLRRVVDWLGLQQGPDGHFLEPGRVIHTELVGSRDSAVTLTAYVLIALQENHEVQAQLQSEVSSALVYLETRVAQGVSSNYSLSLVCYALSLAKSPNANAALSELLRRAALSDGVPTWSSPRGDAGLSLSWQPRSTDIEMVAYVLLTMHQLGRTADAVALVKWLSKQQNGHGGFGGTQDTVVALQTLSVYASLGSDLSPEMNVTIRDSSTTSTTFHINQDNRHLLHSTLQIGTYDGGNASVTAKGRGLLLFQVNVVYNIVNKMQLRRKRFIDNNEAFELELTVFDPVWNKMNLTVCFRLLDSAGLNSTGMAILEVQLLSGFSLLSYTVSIKDLLKKSELDNGKLILYLDSVTREQVCLDILLFEEFKVGKVQEATVELYDYYEPRRRTVRTYSSRWRQEQSSCVFCGGDCSLCAGHSNHNGSAITTSTPPTFNHQHNSEHNHSDLYDHYNGSDLYYDLYQDHYDYYDYYDPNFNLFQSHATLAQPRPALLLLLFALLAL